MCDMTWRKQIHDMAEECSMKWLMNTMCPFLQLRLNKVSELIHNSTHHRNLDMARVTVHFQEIIDLVSACRITLYFHTEAVGDERGDASPYRRT